jgi:hypothetical protein
MPRNRGTTSGRTPCGTAGDSGAAGDDLPPTPTLPHLRGRVREGRSLTLKGSTRIAQGAALGTGSSSHHLSSALEGRDPSLWHPFRVKSLFAATDPGLRPGLSSWTLSGSSSRPGAAPIRERGQNSRVCNSIDAHSGECDKPELTRSDMARAKTPHPSPLPEDGERGWALASQRFWGEGSGEGAGETRVGNCSGKNLVSLAACSGCGGGAGLTHELPR